MKIALAAVAAMLVGAPAMATVTNYTVSAIFTNPEAPVSALTATFSIEQDLDTLASRVSSLNLRILSENYTEKNSRIYQDGDIVIVHSKSADDAFRASGVDDFAITFFVEGYTPSTRIFSYGTIASGYGTARNASVTILRDGPGLIRGYTKLPEPATWAMMLVGIGAIGTEMRRRRISVRHA